MRRADLAMALSLGLAACSTPPRDGRVTETPPDRPSFTPVGLFLDHRCGTLDCHGQSFRNMRLYGYEGMRLEARDVVGGGPTTNAELDLSYRSVIALEPEIMNAVRADHGANPERLTLVRKARGLEKHKGETLMTAGDDQDKCLVSWLGGATDADACTRALATP